MSNLQRDGGDHHRDERMYVPQRDPSAETLSGHGEAGNVAFLPGGLDRSRVVVLPHERHGIARWYAVQHGHACQRGAGPAAPTVAGDLYSLHLGALPCLTQGILCVVAIGRQSEVRPADPSGLPGYRGRRVTEQVEGELGKRAFRRRLPQTTSADRSPGR